MTPLVAALFGLVVGSFLNVVIHRVPLRESVVWPASHCPQCGASIAARDNIPLVSYVLLGGRCRSCKARISPRYPVVEVLTAVLFGAAAFEFASSLELLRALALLAALIALAGTDLGHRLLPNAIVGPATLAGFALSVAISPAKWWVYLVSAAAVAGGLFGLAVAGEMGMGDVKMGGMLGAFLGPYAALAVFIGAAVGAVVSVTLVAAGRMRRRSRIPFGVFMAFGGVAALFFGRDLWELYLQTVF